MRAGQAVAPRVPQPLAADFAQYQLDLSRLRRRALAYAYHLRATNLAFILRRQRQEGQAYRPRVREELVALLETDRANHQAEVRATLADPMGQNSSVSAAWPEIDAAIGLLGTDVDRFVETYFLEGADEGSKGRFSVTSR